MSNLDSPTNLTRMFLDRGRKLEYPEKSRQVQSGKKNPAHACVPSNRNESGTRTFWLWDFSANHQAVQNSMAWKIKNLGW